MNLYTARDFTIQFTNGSVEPYRADKDGLGWGFEIGDGMVTVCFVQPGGSWAAPEWRVAYPLATISRISWP